MKAKQQSGFTLIELVMVIVILGILSAVAIPQFVDLQGDAKRASLQGIAGALASASVINFSACQINGGGACVDSVNTCEEVGALLQGGAIPATAKFSAPTQAISTTGAYTTCTIEDATAVPVISADASVLGTP